jgi:hypothetical protein
MLMVRLDALYELEIILQTNEVVEVPQDCLHDGVVFGHLRKLWVEQFRAQSLRPRQLMSLIIYP